MPTRTGGCLCKAVRYECTGEPQFALQCHCRDCQLQSGAPHVAAVRMPSAGFRIVHGSPKRYVAKADSGNEITRVFCGDCGTPVYVQVSTRPDIVGVRVCTFDDASWFQPEANIFVKSAQPWDHLDPTVPRFETYPTGKSYPNMSPFGSLPLAEQARQLRNPEGDTGLAVAAWLNETNRPGNVRAVDLLALEPGHHVLEIGFGNGRTVPDVLSRAVGVRYAGIDISSSMVDEAVRFNADLVAAGRARFHLGAAKRMPFADASFDRVFSTGVAHFWADPAQPLAEVRRVLRRGGVSLMACLHPRSAPPFARPEYGFHLRDDTAWQALHRAASFSDISAETLEFEVAGPDGTPVKRYGILVMARA